MSKRELMIIVETTNFMQRPSSDSKCIDTLYKNERYAFDRKTLGPDDGVWCHITREDDDGWVLWDDIVVINEPAPASKPEEPVATSPEPRTNGAEPSFRSALPLDLPPTRAYVESLTQHQQVIGLLLLFANCIPVLAAIQRVYIDGLGNASEIIIPMMVIVVFLIWGILAALCQIPALAIACFVISYIAFMVYNYQIVCDIYRIYTRTKEKPAGLLIGVFCLIVFVTIIIFVIGYDKLKHSHLF